jgi:hypothetical protein
VDGGAGAVRLGPDDDGTEVTAAQVRDVVTRLAEAGHWREGNPDILIVFDAGYDVTRLAHLLAGLPAGLLGRLRSDRVLSSETAWAGIAGPRCEQPPLRWPAGRVMSRNIGSVRQMPAGDRLVIASCLAKAFFADPGTG